MRRVLYDLIPKAPFRDGDHLLEDPDPRLEAGCHFLGGFRSGKFPTYAFGASVSVLVCSFHSSQ